MKPTAEALLCLVRLALHEEDADAVFPDHVDWAEVYELSKKQGVTAIAFDALQRIRTKRADNLPMPLPKPLLFRWISTTVAVEKNYARHRAAVSALARYLATENITALIFKGLSLSELYPVPKHRECGDIDILALEGHYKQLDDCLVANGGEIVFIQPKHAEIRFAGVVFEGHRTFVGLSFSGRNVELNKELIGLLPDSEPLFGHENILRPSPAFDALFVLAHAANHFKTEGIVLRHVIDWALVVGANAYRLDAERLKHYGLWNFAAILNRIARQHLGFCRIPQELCVCSDDDYDRVLADILRADSDVPDNLSKRGILLKKYRRFTSRRWTYPIAGDSFGRALLRTAKDHLLQPRNFFR